MNGNNGSSIENFYAFGPTLGTGTFGIVREGRDRRGRKFAIKIFSNCDDISSKSSMSEICNEISFLTEIKHDHIVRLHQVYNEPMRCCLVLEHLSGGDLFDRIVKKERYSEKDARDVCKKIFGAIAFCHERKVAHRDLKPENILLVTKNDDTDVKISDWGLAKKVLFPNSLRTRCGSDGYLAPEIIKGFSYDVQVDLWSLGVVVYILLAGYSPFIDEDHSCSGHLDFNETPWKWISWDAKNLISALLHLDPSKRLSASSALKSRWMEHDDDVSLESGRSWMNSLTSIGISLNSLDSLTSIGFLSLGKNDDEDLGTVDGTSRRSMLSSTRARRRSSIDNVKIDDELMTDMILDNDSSQNKSGKIQNLVEHTSGATTKKITELQSWLRPSSDEAVKSKRKTRGKRGDLPSIHHALGSREQARSSHQLLQREISVPNSTDKSMNEQISKDKQYC